MHGTRLPKNKGGGGFSWQILNNNRLGCNMIHQIDSGIDTGDIIFFKEYIFSQACKIPEDYEKFHNKG